MKALIKILKEEHRAHPVDFVFDVYGVITACLMLGVAVVSLIM